MSKLFILALAFLANASKPAHGQRGDGCGLGYGCFSAPAGCMNQTSMDYSTCEFLFKYKVNPNDNNKIDFELWARVQNPANAYVAIGFSYQEQMPNSSIVMCKFSPRLNLSTVENQYASTKSRPDLVDPAIPSLGISKSTIEMADGAITCKFTRRAKSPSTKLMGKYFDISKPDQLHILAAKGDLDQSGMANYHAKRSCSPFKINFESAESSTAMILQLDHSLVKAHACLMLIAWAFLASIGIMLPRYMKFLFPKRKFNKVDFWFFAHRILMTSVPVISLIAFVIACAACGWSWVDPSHGAGFVHSMTGVVTLGLACFQNLGGYLRPDKEAKARPVFNWSHRLTGFTTFILAIVTTSIAFKMLIPGKKWALVFVWVAWVIFVPMVYEILNAKQHRVSAVTAGDGVKVQEKEDETENLDKMKLVFFVVHFVVQLTITIALMDYVLVYY